MPQSVKMLCVRDVLKQGRDAVNPDVASYFRIYKSSPMKVVLFGLMLAPTRLCRIIKEGMLKYL